MSLIFKVAIPTPLTEAFDYLPPDSISNLPVELGARILVPFGRRTVVGYVAGVQEHSQLERKKLKHALSLLDEHSLLSEDDFRLLSWASQYYHYPLGEVLAAAFPAQLRLGRPAAMASKPSLNLTDAGRLASGTPVPRAPRQSLLLNKLLAAPTGICAETLALLDWDWRKPAQVLVEKGWAVWKATEAMPAPAGTSQASPLSLNAAQQSALQQLVPAVGEFGAFLLEGVTGSGKTEVYLQLVAEVLARGLQAMILLPEINLTPQLEARFRQRFSVPIAIFHSGLNDTERCRAWLSVQRGDVSILLGTRSALFTPLRRPGVIILDEEHDASFKQQEGFRFSARDVAIMRARELKVPVIMGSATPSLETLHNVQTGRYHHLSLPMRAGGSSQPNFQLIDIRSQSLQEGLSAQLIEQIRLTLARGEQALLFLNRRGFAPTLICHACGWVAECSRCDARLVIHAQEFRLRCHYCGHDQTLLKQCPQCRTDDLRPLGLGTERVEQVLGRIFPYAKVARIDRDSTRRKGSLPKLLEQIHAGEINVLIGTQMLAKGHHFPGVTLVGILDVDSGLFSIDFRASERTAQLIVQVAGRAGRETRPGLVLLQTRQPDHPLLMRLIRQGYPGFAKAALDERRAAGLPPYSHQALWRAEANALEPPLRLLEQLRDWTQTLFPGQVQVFGPVAAPMLRQSGRYRYQLLLQAQQRKPLHAAVDSLLAQLAVLRDAKRIRWSVDIDPVDLF